MSSHTEDTYLSFLSDSSETVKSERIQVGPRVLWDKPRPEGHPVHRTLTHELYIPPFHIAKLKPSCFIDGTTRKWIRNAADERAAQEGCFFSNARADFAVDWIEANCVVYEGHLANTPFYLDDWAYEAAMQIFGWMQFDPEWNECIRRFRRVSGWVPKKNGKSPTGASFGTYLWAGDGEPGQKCYSVAKDGPMARIAHMHAVQFVRKNEELGRQCKIDNSTLELTHLPTNSVYQVLYTGSSTNTNSKEGLNGSTLVDETHTVSPELISVIDRAGISRKEPLHLELSTTGRNIEGYGYVQFQRGLQNLQNADKGSTYNPRLLFFNYGIPQSTPLDDIRNPEKIDNLIRISNPALGRLVRYAEIKEDWARSVLTDTTLAEFAMYRLNLWYRSGQGAIATTDWDKCYRHISLKDLKDFPTCIGLDMSKNRDMTSAVIMISVPTNVKDLPQSFLQEQIDLLAGDDPDPDLDYEEIFEQVEMVNIPYCIPFFFLPEGTIPLYKEFIDLRALSERSNLKLSPGLTIRPEAVAVFINSVANQFSDFRVVASDPWRFKEVRKTLMGDFGWMDEQCVGIPQTWANMAPAYECFERLVLQKELVHPADPVYDWQLSNISLVEDKSGNRRIAKPKYGDYRKIDGIAATLNGLTYMCNEEDMVPGSSAMFDTIEA